MYIELRWLKRQIAVAFASTARFIARAGLLLSFSVWPAMTCSFINILLFVFCAVAATAAAATAEMVNVKCCSATATAQ